MAPLGIEPTTFRLVVQCLNQLRHHLPKYKLKYNIKYIYIYIIQSDKTLYFIKLYYLLIPYLLHGAESFLRSQPVFSQSNSPHFMEPEGSLPQLNYTRLKILATCSGPARSRKLKALSITYSKYLKISLKMVLQIGPKHVAGIII